MPIKALFLEIEAVTDAEISQCEKEYLTEEVTGRCLGTLEDPFVRRVLTLLSRESEMWDSQYAHIKDLGALPAQEDIDQRKLDARVIALQAMLEFALKLQVTGQIEWSGWIDHDMLLEVRRSWKIWQHQDIPADELQDHLDKKPARPTRLN